MQVKKGDSSEKLSPFFMASRFACVKYVYNTSPLPVHKVYFCRLIHYIIKTYYDDKSIIPVSS